MGGSISPVSRDRGTPFLKTMAHPHSRFIPLTIAAILIVSQAVCSLADTNTDTVLFREDFLNLKNWKPVLFPKIRKHSAYSVQLEGTRRVLVAESSGSASGLVRKGTFNVYDYPKARWNWKISNLYRAAVDPTSKTSDDYPIRVYFLFEYDPTGSSFMERVTYAVAKRIYGEYPPQAALNYVWSSVDWEREVLVSPYTGKARLIALRKPSDGVGRWHSEEVNIVDDYRRAFGIDPPPFATVGIMNDSDDTKEQSISYVGFIEVFR